MKKLSLEEMMVKAIRQFKKENKNCQIRNVYAWEWDKNGALFNIEYVEIAYGEYHETQIKIRSEV